MVTFSYRNDITSSSNVYLPSPTLTTTAFTVPDLFPGAVQQGLVTANISWLTSFKLALFAAVLFGISGVFQFTQTLRLARPVAVRVLAKTVDAGEKSIGVIRGLKRVEFSVPTNVVDFERVLLTGAMHEEQHLCDVRGIDDRLAEGATPHAEELDLAVLKYRSREGDEQRAVLAGRQP